MSTLTKVILVIVLIIIISVVFLYPNFNKQQLSKKFSSTIPSKSVNQTISNPLAIQTMRSQTYPGSKISIEQTLSPGSNYNQYITSYQSQGLKIYALLAVPQGIPPKNGWPVIVFNHGYIPPNQYVTDPVVGQYASYFPVFAENGYVVFKPDYRGNGNSQGKPEGAYYSPAYTIDDLNAIASIKKFPNVNPNKLGIWGHSMGGNITLRDLVVLPNEIKAAVIWGGVVGSYEDMLHWHDPYYHPSANERQLHNQVHQNLQSKYGTPSALSPFWQAIDPTFYLKNITTPIQLDVGGADQEVPPFFSQNLYTRLKSLGKTVEFYSYPGDNHNISNNFNLAMARSLEFFNKYLK